MDTGGYWSYNSHSRYKYRNNDGYRIRNNDGLRGGSSVEEEL